MRRLSRRVVDGGGRLHLEDVPIPTADAGQLVVDVTIAGVTWPSVAVASRPDTEPFSPGGEIAGRVRAVGDGVSDWTVGDRVVGPAFAGAYADQAVLAAQFATKIPDAVDDLTAVAVLRSGHVALGALQAADVRRGDAVLVTAAAGGVGHLALQLARVLRAGQVIAAVGSLDKREFALAHGADTVLDYRQLTSNRATDEMADVIADGAGGPVLASCCHAAKPFARLVSYAASDAQISTALLRQRSTTVIGFSVARSATLRPDAYRDNTRQLWTLVAAGALRPATSLLPLERADDAHEALLQRRNTGKICLRIADQPGPPAARP